MAEGGVVPVMWRSWSERLKVVLWTPARGVRDAETVEMQDWQWRGSEKVVWLERRGGGRGEWEAENESGEKGRGGGDGITDLEWFDR